MKWLARLCDESGSCTGWQIDYDWQKDARFAEVPATAVWYPAVTIQFSEPQNSVFVAVDLDRERVIYIQKIPDVTSQPAPIGGLPDITGWITDVEDSTTTDNIAGRILVELDESDGTSDKYWVTVPQNTLIDDYREGTRNVRAFSGLETGQQVQVWFGSPVRESYPAQVDASQIDIVLNEEFAVYLLDEDIKPYEMPILSHIELPENPIISIKDIISYSEKTHEIELMPGAYQRIQDLDVPKVFAVTVYRQPIYTGVFWAPWFSMSLDGVVIQKPLSSEINAIQIALGYPSPGVYTGQDPRSNPLIMKSLQRSGKLSN